MSVRADWEFAEARKSFFHRWASPITVSALLLAITTALLWVYDGPLRHDHLIFIYFVPTALIAIRYGNLSAMGVTIASTFAAAYLFYPPRFSFMVDSPLDVLELIFFSLLALFASKVVSGFANDGGIEKRRWRDAKRSSRTRGWLGLPRAGR